MKRWLRLVLQLLSLALFGLIFWLGGPEAWRQVLSGDLRGILPAFLLSGMAGMLAATRLRIIAGSVAGREMPSWCRFYYLNMTARALGLVVPRGLSTLGGKSVALKALGVPLKRSVWLVLMDNVFDVGLLSVLVIPSLLFLRGLISLGGFIALSLGLVAALGGGLWWAIATGRLIALLRWLGRIPWLASVLRIGPEIPADLLPPSPVSLKALGLSVLVNGVIALRFYYIARAVGLGYPCALFVAALPVTQLSLLLAVTPGGLGLFEAGWYGVLLLGGVISQDALSFVIAQRAYVFVFVLIWAGFSALLSLTAEGRGRAP
jgi:uncharacterized membrane protein YbhN (UPF0104 family)